MLHTPHLPKDDARAASEARLRTPALLLMLPLSVLLIVAPPLVALQKTHTFIVIQEGRMDTMVAVGSRIRCYRPWQRSWPGVVKRAILASSLNE